MRVQPYLFLDGRCEEAIAFWQKAIGAELVALMRFKDGPEPGCAPPGGAEKVMHAALRIGDSEIFASDGMCGGRPRFEGTPRPQPALQGCGRAAFAALGAGGE